MASLNSHTQTGCTELDNVTAKHSFLKSPELKAMTFFHLQELLKVVENDDENNKIYRGLLYPALTCKDFLDVALDALWGELDSMVPLLKLLPGLQFEDDAYVCANVHVLLYDLILSLGP
jgi:hypothetical protein